MIVNDRMAAPLRRLREAAMTDRVTLERVDTVRVRGVYKPLPPVVVAVERGLYVPAAATFGVRAEQRDPTGAGAVLILTVTTQAAAGMRALVRYQRHGRVYLRLVDLLDLEPEGIVEVVRQAKVQDHDIAPTPVAG